MADPSRVGNMLERCERSANARRFGTRVAVHGWRSILGFLFLAAAVPLAAQAQIAGGRLEAQGDAHDLQNDMALGTPGSQSAPLTNLVATSPGLEAQIPAPQLRANLLTPFGWNSNAEELRYGGRSSWEIKPLGVVSATFPIGALPFRITGNASVESDRLFRTPRMELDKATLGTRLQYVDLGNDQGFSPYFAFSSRYDFAPTFYSQISSRQDYNLGLNKRFNFDSDFRLIPAAADTSGATVWSFGVTAFVQRRQREPQTSSRAVFVIPSISWVISENWNASLAVEYIGRWFDRNTDGYYVRNTDLNPIATIEYVIPASLFGGERVATLLGRPALDFQGSYLKVWSNVPGGGFSQWKGLVALKTGWRF